MFNSDFEPKTKHRKEDIVLVIKPIDGDKVTSSTGLVDSRLFKGGNSLHMIKNPQNSLWSFKYDSGGLPEALKQQYTSSNKALEYVKGYLKRRGLFVSEVID